MKSQLDGWIFNHDYKHPNISAAMIDLVRKHETTYNDDIAEAIMKETGATNAENVKTIVYLGRKALKDESKKAKDAEMVAAGWQIIPLLNESAEPFAYRGRAMIKASKEIDFMSVALETEGKIIEGSEQRIFFIPKGRRTRGYFLQTLHGYWKPI